MPKEKNAVPLWYTRGVNEGKLHCSYPEVLAKHRYRWFKRPKVSRALDFEWEVFLDGVELGTEKHAELVLLRRTWESIKALVPEKANYHRRRAEMKKARLFATRSEEK